LRREIDPRHLLEDGIEITSGDLAEAAIGAEDRAQGTVGIAEPLLEATAGDADEKPFRTPSVRRSSAALLAQKEPRLGNVTFARIDSILTIAAP
jgi:hypothetical protein